MPPSALAPAVRGTVTPVKQTAAAPVAKESPGNWRHPRLAEITQRQSKTVFSEKNAKQVAYNVAALAIFIFLRGVVRSQLPETPQVQFYGTILSAMAVLVPIFNISRALLPLVRQPDDLSDIPLTPAQRKLLGLPPSSKPETPNSAYSTPPRYSRTPSLAGSPASIRSYASSPTAAIGSPVSVSNSPAAASPLLHKVVGGVRRSSFGASGQFGASTTSLLDGPSTPSPATGKRSSVSLNNKWLYEKGRRSSGNVRLQGL